jgi:hypothetical protein
MTGDGIEPGAGYCAPAVLRAHEPGEVAPAVCECCGELELECECMGPRYSWSTASALWQLEHGGDNPRTSSARAYLEERLA